MNLRGVTVLTKKEQVGIHGGSINCRFTILSTDGGRDVLEIAVATDNGNVASSTANSTCASLVTNDKTVSRCFYDCEHDGFGQ